MRLRGKIDRNQPEIVRALGKIGASVRSMADLGDGTPDLLVGFRGKNFCLEVKDGLAPPSKRKLTPDQRDWHDSWRGQVVVVESVSEALAAVAGEQK